MAVLISQNIHNIKSKGTQELQTTNRVICLKKFILTSNNIKVKQYKSNHFDSSIINFIYNITLCG